MRNAAIITSILFAAIACDRDSTSADRNTDPIRVIGTTNSTGPSGASTNVPGQGRGATGASETMGATDTIGTVDHIPNGSASGAGANGVASRTGDGNSATMANGTRTGTMGSHGAVDSDDATDSAASRGTTGGTGTGAVGATGPTATADGDAAMTENGTRTGRDGSHGATHPEESGDSAAKRGSTGDMGNGATGAGTGTTATGVTGTATGTNRSGTGTEGTTSTARNGNDGTTGTVGTRAGSTGTVGTRAGSTGTGSTSSTSSTGSTATMSGNRGTQPMSDDRAAATGTHGSGTHGSGTHGSGTHGTGSHTANIGSTGGPSGGIAPTTGHSISCAQLIPRAVQRQYLANMTITPTSHGTDMATSCRIEGRGVDAAAQVQAWCNSDEDSAPQPDSPAPVPGSKAVGKAAILVDAGELQQLTAWDSDSSCQITIAVPKTVDAMALGRRMLDALPVKPIVGSRDDG